MELNIILLIAYLSISIVHFAFHLSMFHTIRMIDNRIKNTRSRKSPVHLYHSFHLKLSLAWPLSICLLVRDVFFKRS